MEATLEVTTMRLTDLAFCADLRMPTVLLTYYNGKAELEKTNPFTAGVMTSLGSSAFKWKGEAVYRALERQSQMRKTHVKDAIELALLDDAIKRLGVADVLDDDVLERLAGKLLLDVLALGFGPDRASHFEAFLQSLIDAVNATTNVSMLILRRAKRANATGGSGWLN
jgi:hypothetical protein